MSDPNEKHRKKLAWPKFTNSTICIQVKGFSNKRLSHTYFGKPKLTKIRNQEKLWFLKIRRSRFFFFVDFFALYLPEVARHAQRKHVSSILFLFMLAEQPHWRVEKTPLTVTSTRGGGGWGVVFWWYTTPPSSTEPETEHRVIVTWLSKGVLCTAKKGEGFFWRCTTPPFKLAVHTSWTGYIDIASFLSLGPGVSSSPIAIATKWRSRSHRCRLTLLRQAWRSHQEDSNDGFARGAVFPLEELCAFVESGVFQVAEVCSSDRVLCQKFFGNGSS